MKRKYSLGFEVGSQENIFGQSKNSDYSDSSESESDHGQPKKKRSKKTKNTSVSKKKRASGKVSKRSSLTKDKDFMNEFKQSNKNKNKNSGKPEIIDSVHTKEVTKPLSESNTKNINDNSKEDEKEHFLNWRNQGWVPMSKFLSKAYHYSGKSLNDVVEEAMKDMDKTIFLTVENEAKNGGKTEADEEKAREKFFSDDTLTEIEDKLKMIHFGRLSESSPVLQKLVEEEKARETIFREPAWKDVYNCLGLFDPSFCLNFNTDFIGEKVKCSLNKLIENTHKNLPIIDKQYVLDFFRECIPEFKWERQCRFLDRCLGMLLPQIFPDSRERSAVTECLILREFLLPEQLRRAIRNHDDLPKENQPCIVCNRALTTIAYWRNMKSGISSRVIIQDHGYVTEGESGYSKSDCINPVNNSKFYGIIAPFVMFSASKYVATKQNVTIEIGKMVLKRTVRSLKEISDDVQNYLTGFDGEPDEILKKLNNFF